MPHPSADDQSAAIRAKLVIAAVCFGRASVFSSGLAVALEQADRSSYAAAVSYCRSKAGRLVLNEDRSIFCFDGKVSPDRDVSSLRTLNSEGLFVVRSPGGSVIAAARIATLLEEKKATIVIYDYCISACASFFFVAAARTYVLKDSIVAWHYGWRGSSACGYGVEYRSAELLKAGLCYEYRETLNELRSVATPFYKRRIVDLKLFNLDSPPKSQYIARILRSRQEGTGSFPEVAWMLNPRYYSGDAEN